MIHLTLTGVEAGRTLCGAPRVEGGAYAHAAYAPRELAGVCPRCRVAWRHAATTARPTGRVARAIPACRRAWSGYCRRAWRGGYGVAFAHATAGPACAVCSPMLPPRPL